MENKSYETVIEKTVKDILGDGTDDLNRICASIFCESQLLGAAAMEASDKESDENREERIRDLHKTLDDFRTDMVAHCISLKGMMDVVEKDDPSKYRAALQEKTLPEATRMMESVSQQVSVLGEYMRASECSYIHDLGRMLLHTGYMFVLCTSALRAASEGKCPEEWTGSLLGAALSVHKSYDILREMNEKREDNQSMQDISGNENVSELEG